MPLRGVQSEEKTGASLNVPGGHVCRVHWSLASVFMWPGKVRSMPKHQDWWYGYSRAKGPMGVDWGLRPDHLRTGLCCLDFEGGLGRKMC